MTQPMTTNPNGTAVAIVGRVDNDFSALFELVQEYADQEQIDEESREIIKTLLSPDAELEIATDPSVSDEEVWRETELICRLHVKFQKALFSLKPIIAKLLLEIEKRPQLYIARGCKDFSQFLQSWVPANWAIPRSEAWKIVKIARAFPSYKPRDILEAGYPKMTVVSQYMNETNPKAKMLIDLAPRTKLDDFYTLVAQETSSDEKEFIKVKFDIKCSLSQREFYDEFFSDPRVQAWARSNSPAVILESAIQEVMNEAIAQGEQMMRQRLEDKRSKLAQTKSEKEAQRNEIERRKSLKRGPAGDLASALEGVINDE